MPLCPKLKLWRIEFFFFFPCISSFVKEKDEKRPWILRAREASVQIESKTEWGEIQSWPQTLIYISCRWESFKEVVPGLSISLSRGLPSPCSHEHVYICMVNACQIQSMQQVPLCRWPGPRVMASYSCIEPHMQRIPQPLHLAYMCGLLIW